jgi:hypothetical protein
MEFLECMDFLSFGTAWAVFEQGTRLILQGVGGMTLLLIALLVLDHKYFNSMYWEVIASAKEIQTELKGMQGLNFHLEDRIDGFQNKIEGLEGRIRGLAADLDGLSEMNKE